jgi:hypothetical protein
MDKLTKWQQTTPKLAALITKSKYNLGTTLLKIT